ncbi:MAG: ATP-binding protein [Candidatus Methanomethylophilaceae archaeon]|nr:ATP-binding protein [Candidatus Methanomethylophilaceae archaeon]
MTFVGRKRTLETLRLLQDKRYTVKVVTGMRGCGKTALLRKHYETLMDGGADIQDLHYLCFEETDGKKIKGAKALDEWIRDHVSKERTTHLFLDEIQHVEGWEPVVHRLAAKGCCDVYVASSYLASIPENDDTVRWTEIPLFPFSFKEFVEYYGRDDVQTAFSDYLVFGGMPTMVMTDRYDVNSDYLKSRFYIVLMEDVLSHHFTGSIYRSMDLMRYIFENLGVNISDIMASRSLDISSNTVSRYLDELCASGLLVHGRRYEMLGSLRLESIGKYYIADHAIRNVFLDSTDLIFTKGLLENVVYIELLRRGYPVSVGDWKLMEADFTISTGSGKMYLEVATNLSIPKVRQRCLTKLRVNVSPVPRMILALNTAGYSYLGKVEVKDLMEWLLEE